MRPRRALTLLETLLSLALMALVIALVAGLFQRVSRLNPSFDRQTLLQEQAGSTLPAVLREARQAVKWSVPTPGSSSPVSELRFQVPHPASARFPDPLPVPLPALVDFQASGWLLERRLRRQNGGLWLDDALLCPNVQNFSARLLGADFLEVELEVLTSSGQPLRLRQLGELPVAAKSP